MQDILSRSEEAPVMLLGHAFGTARRSHLSVAVKTPIFVLAQLTLPLYL